jgi:hypothetical protein
MSEDVNRKAERPFAVAHGSAFVVQDLTGEVEPMAFNSRESASKWVAHLMEWRPNARPTVDSANEIILEALKAGLVCAENCRLNATYHRRTIIAALTVAPSMEQEALRLRAALEKISRLPTDQMASGEQCAAVVLAMDALALPNKK